MQHLEMQKLVILNNTILH